MDPSLLGPVFGPIVQSQTWSQLRSLEGRWVYRPWEEAYRQAKKF